jgi:hypothetical protein
MKKIFILVFTTLLTIISLSAQENQFVLGISKPLSEFEDTDGKGSLTLSYNLYFLDKLFFGIDGNFSLFQTYVRDYNILATSIDKETYSYYLYTIGGKGGYKVDLGNYYVLSGIGIGYSHYVNYVGFQFRGIYIKPNVSLVFKTTKKIAFGIDFFNYSILTQYYTGAQGIGRRDYKGGSENFFNIGVSMYLK